MARSYSTGKAVSILTTEEGFWNSTDVRHRQGEPERLLWAAVIGVAVHDIVHAKSLYKAQQAFDWFESDCTQLGSFLFCCEVLNLSSEWYRKQAKQFLMEKKRTISNMRFPAVASVGEGSSLKKPFNSAHGIPGSNPGTVGKLKVMNGEVSNG